MTKKFDIDAIRKEFPVFEAVKPYQKPLTYLDSAATAQKPQFVLDKIQETYIHNYANVHRGIYHLANEATILFEGSRKKVQNFVNASRPEEIIWTSGGTDGFNLLSYSLGHDLKEGDEIILSKAEHHSNIVPWHFLRERRKCVIKWLDINDKGEIDLDQLSDLLSHKTKIVSITHMSNVLGTVNPIKVMAQKIHEYDALFIVDGCQAVVHCAVDVQDLDIDFYVVTGHKLYGPSGIGFIYGKYALLEKIPPFRGGGEMIDQVTLDNVTYNTPPHRLEAGTPPIVQAIGLGYAIDYITQYSVDDIISHENNLTEYCHKSLLDLGYVNIFGTSLNKGAVISFEIEGIHPHDFATYADRKGIAMRAGHHCCQPLMTHLRVSATLRASFGIYNTNEDIDILIDIIKSARDFFV